MKKPLIIGAAADLAAKALATAVAVCGMCLTASAEDAYIESYGTGSICLGHFAGPNTKIEVDMEMKEVAFDTQMFGADGGYSASTTVPLFYLYIGNKGDGKPRFSWRYAASDGRD